jgi:hypothetical protein
VAGIGGSAQVVAGAGVASDGSPTSHKQMNLIKQDELRADAPCRG